MNNTLGSIWYSLGIDNSSLQRDAQQAKGVIRNIGDTMVNEGKRIDNVYHNLSRNLAFVFTTSSAGVFINQLVKVRGEVQQLEITFNAMLGSKAKADKLMSEVVAFASNTPFDLKDIGASTRMLLSVGESAEKVIPTLKALGDVASATGVSMERLILNYSQVKNKGVLSSIDLKDFLTAGVPIIGELAKNLNVAEAEIKEMVSAGKIGFTEVEKAFYTMSAEGGKFNDLMAKQSQSVKGAISGLKLEIYKMFNDIGKSGEGVFTRAISSTTELVKNYKSIGKTIAELIATYGTYKAVLMSISAVQKLNRVVLAQAVVEKKLASAANITLSNSEAVAVARTKILSIAKMQLTNVTRALNATLLANPYVLVAAAVAGLAYGLYKLATRATAAEKALSEFNESQGKIKQKIEDENNEIQNLLNTLKDENNARELRTRAYNTLIQKYPDLFAKYQTEMDMLRGIEEANKAVALSAHAREIAENKQKIKEAKQALEKAQTESQEYTKQTENLVYTSGAGAATALLAKQQSDDAKKQQAKIKLLTNRIQYLEREQIQANFNNLTQEEKKIELQKLRELQKRRNNIEDHNVYTTPTGNKRQIENLLINTSDYEKLETGNVGYLAAILEKQIKSDEKHVTTYLERSKVLFNQMQEAKKQLNEAPKLKGLTDVQLDEEVKKRQEAYNNAKKAYEDFTNSASKKGVSNKKADDAKKQQEEIVKAETELNRLRKDNELKAQKDYIETMAEGYEKERALIDFHFKEKSEIIDRGWEDTIASLTKRKKDGELTSQQFDAFVTEADNIRTLGNKNNEDVRQQQEEKLLKELLDKYKTYEEELTETTKKYAQERIILEQNLTGEALKKRLELNKKAEEKQKRELAKKYKPEGDVIGALFDDFSTKSIEQLEELEKKAEIYFNEIKDSADPEFLAEYRQRMEDLRKKTEESYPFFKRISNLLKNISSGGIGKKDALKRLTNEMIGVIGVAQELTTSFIEISQALNIKGAKGNFEDLNNVMSKATQYAKAGSMFGPFGTVIGMGVGMITGHFQNIQKAEERMAQKRREWKEEQLRLEENIHKLQVEQLLSGEKHSNSFLIDNINKHIEVLDKLDKTQNNLRNKAKELQEQYYNNDRLFTTGTFKLLKELELKQRGIKFKTEIQSIKDDHYNIYTYKKIKEEFGELVDINGTINTDLIKSLTAEHEVFDKWLGGYENSKLIEKNKELLRDLKLIFEDFEKYKKDVSQHITSVFGDLGKNFADNIISSVEKGESAFENFGNVVSSVMKKFLKDLLVTKEVKALFDELEQDLTNVRLYSNKEDLAKNMARVVLDFNNNKLKPIIEEKEREANSLFELLEQNGLKMYGDASLKSGQNTTFQSMNQDTGSELRARFSLMNELQRVSNEELKKAVTIAQGIKESTDFMKDFSAKSLQHLANIDVNTGRLAKIETDISKMSSNFEEIKLHGLKIK